MRKQSIALTVGHEIAHQWFGEYYILHPVKRNRSIRPHSPWNLKFSKYFPIHRFRLSDAKAPEAQFGIQIAWELILLLGFSVNVLTLMFKMNEFALLFILFFKGIPLSDSIGVKICYSGFSDRLP